MKRIKRSKKRGPVVSKKVEYDGIKFASGLEKYMYIALRENGINATYEKITYTVFEAFDFGNRSYERTMNSKGEFKNRGGAGEPLSERGNVMGYSKPMRAIKYTPDFEGNGFIIECKGRPNETFSMRWKMFKKYLRINNPTVILFKPQNQKECDRTIELILESRNISRGKNIKKGK